MEKKMKTEREKEIVRETERINDKLEGMLGAMRGEVRNIHIRREKVRK